jgi:hypothetical protein
MVPKKSTQAYSNRFQRNIFFLSANPHTLLFKSTITPFELCSFYQFTFNPISQSKGPKSKNNKKLPYTQNHKTNFTT